MDNLISRLGRMGFLLVIGVCLVVYIAFGLLYWQQQMEQEELQEKIGKMSSLVSKPLPDADELRAEYDEVNNALSPFTVSAALQGIVNIARKSGLDVSPDSGLFNIPAPGEFEEREIGEGIYQVLPLHDIRAQGDPDSVAAFIADLDSGQTLKTMVLKKMHFSQIEVSYEGEEADRRAEFRAVISAVREMMTGNGISALPYPVNSQNGTATNYLGDDPGTGEIVEGFPDIITTAAEKGYTGTGAPKAGYVLYGHDKISADDTTQFETVNYVSELMTRYYYTCEADGTVRQFDGPDLATATEYLDNEASRVETIIVVDMELYAKLLEESQPEENQSE